MLNFEKTKVKANIYGEAYELRRPTVKEAQDYAKRLKNEEESSDELIKLMDGLGLPAQVALGMEASHLTQLIEALVPSEKK